MNAAPLWTDALASWSTFASAIIGLLALAAIVSVGYQLRLQRTQIHRDLENLYIERYWTIMDALANAELATPDERSVRRDIAIRAYLQLSEDECDLRAADRVTDETWREWRAGIRAQLESPEFRAALDAFPEDRLSNLRKLVVAGYEFEPSSTAVRARQKKGL